MSKRIFAIVISTAILTGSFGLQAVFGQSATFDAQASKARAKVESLGNNARVEVKLRDTTKVNGNISTITPDSFTVTDAKTGTTNTVAYADVAEVKKPGSGLSTKSWIIIGSSRGGNGSHLDHSEARLLRWRRTDARHLLIVHQTELSSLSDRLV